MKRKAEVEFTLERSLRNQVKNAWQQIGTWSMTLP